jgi:D-alanyl-D-alanine carboxypeptidase
MKTKRSTCALLLGTAALCWGGAGVRAEQPAALPLQQCVAAEAQKSGFSGVISIARPGGDVTVAHGVMAGADSPPMLPNAQFNIGSAGKMWTAVAVAQLVDRGKLSLDDPIGRYVGGLTAQASAVTIRQLLTHSAGLGNFFTPDNLALFKRAKSLAELKPLIVAEKPAFTPGARSQYSNSGFLLLGLLVEQVSGQTYGDYLRAHIFRPAGMTASSTLPESATVRATGLTNFPAMEDGPPPPPDQAEPPRRGAPGAPQFPPPGPLRPSEEALMMGSSAGGSFSTPSDMQRFFAALLGGKLTSVAMRDALTSPQIGLLPAKGNLPAVDYGLGFTISAYQGRKWVGHNGGLPGASVATAAFPADRVTAVVMSNRDPFAADAMLRKVQAMVFDPAACGGKAR